MKLPTSVKIAGQRVKIKVGKLEEAYGLHNTKTGDFKIWQVTKNGSDWISPHGIL